MVHNPPSSVGDVGLIADRRTEMAYATEQRSPYATAAEPTSVESWRCAMKDPM